MYYLWYDDDGDDDDDDDDDYDYDYDDKMTEIYLLNNQVLMVAA